MKLGIIGWYGHDNYGDERILYCLKRYFSNDELFVTGDWEDARCKLEELNNCDFVLIGGGGLILRNICYHTDIICNLKRPFGLIGVSVEAKHKSMNCFLKIIKDKADFIMVRDKQSKTCLDDHNKVIIGPDLTFLYPFDIVDEVKNDICGFNLRDWYYWKGVLYGSFHNLMLRIDKRFPWVRKYYWLRKWDPNKIVRIVKKSFEMILPMPFYFESTAKHDAYVLSRYFQDVPSVFDASIYHKIRYLIGMRYHSIIFAVQSGIPFISMSYQPKNESFCSDIGLEMLSVNIYKSKELDKKIEYLKNNYQQIRNHLIYIRDKSNQDIVDILKLISEIIEERTKNRRKLVK